MPEAKTEQYKVLKKLEHDGNAYLPGAQIELQQGTASYLLRKGMVKMDRSAKNNKENKA